MQSSYYLVLYSCQLLLQLGPQPLEPIMDRGTSSLCTNIRHAAVSSNQEQLSIYRLHIYNRNLVSTLISPARGITTRLMYNFFSVQKASLWSQGGIVAIFQRATKN